MDNFILDFSACKTLDQLYAEINRVIKMDVYVTNLDGLWDMLGYWDDMAIEIYGLTDYMHRGAGEYDYAQKLMRIFDDIKAERKNVEIIYHS